MLNSGFRFQFFCFLLCLTFWIKTPYVENKPSLVCTNCTKWDKWDKMFIFQAAVEVFGLVQELLPAVSALNQKYAPPTFNPNQSTDSTTGNQAEQGLSACTTSSHYSVMESDHPYKQAGVTQYRVRCLLFVFLLNNIHWFKKQKSDRALFASGIISRLCPLDHHWVWSTVWHSSTGGHSTNSHTEQSSSLVQSRWQTSTSRHHQHLDRAEKVLWYHRVADHCACVARWDKLSCSIFNKNKHLVHWMLRPSL